MTRFSDEEIIQGTMQSEWHTYIMSVLTSAKYLPDGSINQVVPEMTIVT